MRIDTSPTETRIANALRDHPLKTPIAWALAVAFVGVNLGFFTGWVAVFATFAILLVLLLFAAVVILGIARRDLLRQMRVRDSVLDWYGQKLIDRQNNEPNHYKFLEWKEDISVLKDGTGHLIRTYRILVTGTEPLDAFWNRSTPSAPLVAPASINARLLDEDGVGVDLDVTHKWDGDGIRTFVHLGRDYPIGSELIVEIEWVWPSFFKRFVSGSQETRQWRMLHDADLLEARFRIAEELVRRNPVVSAIPGSESLKPRRVAHRGGSITFELTAENLKPGDTFGYVLQLQQKQ